MDIDAIFSTSKRLEKDGVWHELGDGAAIRIARWNNPAQQELERTLRRREMAKIKTGKLTAEDNLRIMIEAMAHTVLLDWRGLELGGEKLPAYTPEQGLRALSDTPNINRAQFRDAIAALSNDASLFRLEHEAEAGKNSPASSSGG